MNGVNKTLYIPLYGKSYVSKKGIILKALKYFSSPSSTFYKNKDKNYNSQQSRIEQTPTKRKPSRLSSNILNYNSEKPKVLN